MTTIEERAIKNADNNSYTDKVRSASIGSYMLGATDQKKIDIEKACEWIMNTPMYAKQPNQLVEEFRKAMEE